MLLGISLQCALTRKVAWSMQSTLFQDKFLLFDTEGILMINAGNAFDGLNRGLALPNLAPFVCRVIVCRVFNSYSTPSDLFTDGHTLESQDGTAEGDHLATSMYGIDTPSPKMTSNALISQKRH